MAQTDRQLGKHYNLLLIDLEDMVFQLIFIWTLVINC